MNTEIMTISEVASYLHIGQSKLYRLAQEGKIPATRIGRSWRFRRDLVDAWFVQDTVRAASITSPSTAKASG